MRKASYVVTMSAIFYMVGFALSITLRSLLDLLLPWHRVRWGYDLHWAAWEGLEMLVFTRVVQWRGRKASLSPDYLGARDMAPPEGVRELIRRGQKIQAIKLYREYAPVGLKEAKDAVEAMAAERKAGLWS